MSYFLPTAATVRTMNNVGANIYTFAATDGTTWVIIANPYPSLAILTIPLNASVPIAVGTVMEMFMNTTHAATLLAQTGVTLYGRLKAFGQGAWIQLVKTATDTWYANGTVEGYGYFMGGLDSGGSIQMATTDRIAFSTATTAAYSSANLSVGRGAHPASMSDCLLYGYACGGSTGAASAVTDRLVYSTGVTTAATVSNLLVARWGAACVNDGVTYGYVAGGYTGAADLTTERMTYSTGVFAARTTANLSLARYRGFSLSDSGVVGYGYYCGGYSSAACATADRFTFSTGTTAAFTAADLRSARYRAGHGLSDSVTSGYFIGGLGGTTTVDKLTFSTGVTAADTTATLDAASSYSATLSDGCAFGYFSGNNVMHRFNYQTNSSAAIAAANLSNNRYEWCNISDSCV